MPSYITAVPASTEHIRFFFNQERSNFENDLRQVRDLVQKATASLPIYKIYGRDDKQGGMLLKHPRKIRLKFNSFCQDRGLREGSLWTVPDIIGFTVVVVFPSDINAVCQIVDKLIQDKKLFNASNEPAAAEEQPAQDDSSKRRATALIETRYGRALIRDGYFACHYNVRRIGIDAFRPICEIQIKTVLHDAWGAKSHDLTYKPSGKISQELILNFNLLGDSLAKLDEQSDLVRRTIERTARVRDLKRRRVQETTIVAAARNLAKDNETLRAIVEAIELGNEDAGSICGKLTELFAEHKRAVCTALSLLSVKTNSADYFQQTLEHIESWFESETTDFRKASSKSVAALSAYSVGDPGLAIEMGEVAVELIELARKNDLDDDERLAVERTANAIYSSMAYYHADRIGSHEGELGKSRAAAIDCMNKSLECRRSLNQLPLGLDSPDDAIEAALRCKTTGWSSFCALDNDAFVRIQTSTSEPALRAARERFEFVHKERAIEWMSMAGYLHDYHDYCARARLAELETETETEIK